MMLADTRESYARCREHSGNTLHVIEDRELAIENDVDVPDEVI